MTHTTELTPERIESLRRLVVHQRGFGLPFDAASDLLALLDAQLAGGKCETCGGKGYVYEGEAITGRGPGDVFPEKAACPDCQPQTAATDADSAVGAQSDAVAVAEVVRGLRDLQEFLCGEREIEGVSFGERHPRKVGKFWWRSNLLRPRIDRAM